jgi:hypothetical protein
VGTAAPVYLGVGAEVRLGALRLAADVGWMPRAYSNGIDTFLVAVAAYDEATSALIRDSLANSAVLDLEAGTYPWRDLGFYAAGGYTLATIGGGATGADVVAEITGEEIPSERRFGESVDLSGRTTLHNLHATAGWRFVPVVGVWAGFAL